MYCPPAFREDDPDALAALIAAHPLGLLILHGPEGLLAVHVPFLYAPGETLLRAHLARANPAAERLASGAQEVLVVFQGEQGYISPSWYPSKNQTHREVPTWNYATVQARGRAELNPDPAALRTLLDGLTDTHESGRAQPWSSHDAPEGYIDQMMRVIVALEVRVSHLAGKFKYSQNKAAPERAGVLAGLTEPRDAHHHPALAHAMSEALVRPLRPPSAETSAPAVPTTTRPPE